MAKFSGASIQGKNLQDFLRWAFESFEWRDGNLPDDGLLALPPIQRNAVWNPQQVIDVWDSVLRGLPLGAFMVQAREEGKLAHAPDAANALMPAGWDLLDGQQRVRSLLLGLYGPSCHDKRCLWINLDRHSDRYLFHLSITSAGQPFGYDAKGSKLPPVDRAAARRRYEPKSSDAEEEADTWEIRVGERRALDHELFDGFIKATRPLRLVRDGQSLPIPPKAYPSGWPPAPAGVQLTSGDPQKTGLIPDNAMIMPLHQVFSTWWESTGSKEDALASLVARSHPRFKDLVDALNRFDKAEIALINATSVTKENLPLLFDRIGAGGTPLTHEERLFSLYKYHCPSFHDLIREIYKCTGRVMAPSKIAASAIRVANALAHQQRDLDAKIDRAHEGNALPDVATFAKAFHSEHTVDIRAKLDELLIDFNGKVSIHGQFATSFAELFRSLKYDANTQKLGLPTVLLWRLPPSLVQVLLFWLISRRNEGHPWGDDLVRFAMFWLLGAWPGAGDQLSNYCFKAIRQNPDLTIVALCRELSESRSLTKPILTPDFMTQVLVREVNPLWRTEEARLKGLEPSISLSVRSWWQDETKFLPWLQRAYLADTFRDFDPASDREDDTPYDIDHIIPRNDWGFYWGHRTVRMDSIARFSKHEEKQLQDGRLHIGDSIGNKWLVDYSSNRAWGDKSCKAKISDISADQNGTLRGLIDVFPLESHALWLKASSPNNTQSSWNDLRMSAFQEAVERRAALLYRRLYNDLRLGDFVSG